MFSSKPKESERVEFHPEKAFNMLHRTIYDEKTNDIKSGTIWNAGFDFTNLKNIIYLVDQVEQISEKLDKVLAQNQELQSRLENLEHRAEIKVR